MSAGGAQQEGAAKQPYGNGYSRYALALLVVVYVSNFVDRTILNILVEPIKNDLGVGDAAMGFLTGTAFALFYATLGMPIARIADRTSRTRVITISLTLWSFMTAVSGLVLNYWQLALARIGVAVGEAGASPPAHSLIADYFPPEKRATALGIYSLGIPIGSMLGAWIGGPISDHFSWRVAFFIVGLPGLLLALVVGLTLREPRKDPKVTMPEVATDTPSLLTVARTLRTRRSFWHMSLACALHAFVGYGVGTFIFAYFERSFGMSRTEIGLIVASVAGVAGIIGTYAGGILADRLARFDKRWYMWMPALSMAISFPFYIAGYTNPDPWITVALLFIPNLLGNTYLGPSFAMGQSLVPVRMRAMTAAILLFVLNLIGLGLGPWVTGGISDLALPYYDGDTAQSLRFAILTVVCAKLWSAFHYWRASITLREDLDRASEIAT